MMTYSLRRVGNINAYRIPGFSNEIWIRKVFNSWYASFQAERLRLVIQEMQPYLVTFSCSRSCTSAALAKIHPMVLESVCARKDQTPLFVLPSFNQPGLPKVSQLFLLYRQFQL